MGFVFDCSHYQGAINWAQVAADGCVGAYVKVTDGAGTADPDWQTNHAAAQANGIPIGPYHFAEGGDAGSEAANFAAAWAAGWQLHPVLDYEISSANASWLAAFRTAFRADTGFQGFRVYSSLSLLEGALNPSGWLDSNTSIWVARYNTTLGWSNTSAVLWQNTDAATVPGIVGSVDEDQFLNGWTPAADGGTMTDPVEEGFTYSGGTTVDASANGTIPAGVDPYSIFGRLITLGGFAFQGGTTVDASANGTVPADVDPNSIFGRLIVTQAAIASLETQVAALATALTAATQTLNAVQQTVSALQPSTLSGSAEVTVTLTPGGSSS